MAHSAKNKGDGELVFGVHSILELLKQKKRKVLSIYTTKPEPKIWPMVEALRPAYPINIQYVSRDILTRIAGSPDHQGILAWAQPFPMRSRAFTPDKSPTILMLDGIQDPRNLGAIIRSAYCTGVHGIVVCQKGGSPLTATVHKASAGLLERTTIYSAPSAAVALQEIKKAGYSIYLATLNGTDATKVTYTAPTCLVIGSEGAGITPSLLSHGTQITIPQITPEVSYNASVAAGILLFTIAHALKK